MLNKNINIEQIIQLTIKHQNDMQEELNICKLESEQRLKTLNINILHVDEYAEHKFYK